MDKFEENLREILAQSKHKSSGAERFVRASLAENKYPREFLIYFLNSECFGDYESENPSYEAWQHQQAKVEELQKQFDQHDKWLGERNKDVQELNDINVKHVAEKAELQKRVDYLEHQLSIKTRHCEFFEKSRIGHRSIAIMRKLQIEKALKQIEALYTKAEKDYEQDSNPYYDGMLSALDLAEQAIRGELEEQALKGEV